MRLLAFSVFDVKVGAYMAPFFSPAIGHAVRSFEDVVNDPQSQVSKHPADYRLFHVGAFDDGTGGWEPEAPPKLVAEAISFVVAARPDQDAVRIMRKAVGRES